MRLRIQNWRLLLILSFVSPLIGCTEATTQPPFSVTPTEATTQPAFLITPTNAIPMKQHLFPDIVNCSDVVLTKTPSLEWNGLKVGTSNRAEFEAFVKPSIGNFDDVFHLWRYWRTPGNNKWGLLEACFTNDNILSALNVSNTVDFPAHLDTWLNDYGKPDRVTWADENYVRSLIWYDKGILAAYYFYRKYTRNVILFAPVSASTWEDSWVFRALPKESAPPGDAFIVTAEDPWKIQK